MNSMNLPTEVVISGKGWCSDEIGCNIAKDECIKVDCNSVDSNFENFSS